MAHLFVHRISSFELRFCFDRFNTVNLTVLNRFKGENLSLPNNRLISPIFGGGVQPLFILIAICIAINVVGA